MAGVGGGALVGGRLRRWLRSLLAAAATCVAAIGIATFHRRTPLPLEGRADLWLARPAGGEHRVAVDVAHLGDPAAFVLILLGIVAVLIVCGDAQAAAVAVAATAVQLLVAEVVLKPLVDRHLPGAGGGSFPSGHAGSAFALAVVVALAATRRRPLGRRLGALGRTVLVVCALALATLIGLTMVVLQSHYLGDVLAGAALGGGTALAVAALADRVTSRRRVWVERSAERVRSSST